MLLSKRLVTIIRDLPVPLDLEALAVGEPDRERLKQLFAELEFHGLVREIAAPEPETARLDAKYRTVESAAKVRDVVARIRAEKRVSLHVLGTSPEGPMRAGLVGLAVATGEGEGWYLPLTHRTRRETLELDFGGDGAGEAVTACLFIMIQTVDAAAAALQQARVDRARARKELARSERLFALEPDPSTPVNLWGFDEAPGAGEHFYVLDDIAQAREIAEHSGIFRRRRTMPERGVLP